MIQYQIAKKYLHFLDVIMPLIHMIIFIIITLCTLNCINMILSDLFGGSEVVYRFYYLIDEPIIIIYYVLLCLLYVYVMTFIIRCLNCLSRSTDKF